MIHLGDFARGETVRHLWSTVGLSGASITRAVNGTVVVYKDGGTTEITLGITDTEDFDTRTGLHLLEVALSDAAYSAGSHFTAVVHTMTVDGQGPIVAPLCSWTIGKSGIIAKGTLLGTHSATTADLGTNAPGVDIGGQTLWFPGHQVVRTVDSFVIGTGVATFKTTAVTLVDGDVWILLATAPASDAGLNAIADAVHDEVVEGTTTLRQSIRAHNSALASKASGMGTATGVFRDIGDTKNRITATQDADGNRSAITLDLT